MTNLTDPSVRRLLEEPNAGVASTLNADGSVHSTVVWLDVQVRGTASGTTEGADAHIDRLAKKYLDMDAYPWRAPGEQRITFVVDAQRVRHQKAG